MADVSPLRIVEIGQLTGMRCVLSSAGVIE